MSIRNKSIAALNRHTRGIRIAGAMPVPPKAGGLDNEVAGHVKRAIPKGYEYDPKAIKPLAKMLWAMSVSLGHAMTAHRQFTKMKSSTVSPDGLIGGRGYVMAVKDVRKALYDACEGLSAVSDTIHDEINAPHWKSQLARLEREDVDGVERLVGEAERILDNPEEGIDDAMEEAEDEGPQVELEEEPGSEIPDGDGLVDARPAPKRDKQASAYSYRRANSSIPVDTLSGPRVQHLDRGDVDQTGPFGSYNSEEPRSMHDDWSKNDGGKGNEYDYVSEWDNDLSEKSATSMVPDSNTDSTPTQGYDFGIGYGEGNDAHGQGAGGYSNVDSDGKGVWGPHAEMPDDPGGATDDTENDSTPSIEISVSRSSMPRTAAYEMKGLRSIIVRGREYKVRYVTRGDHGDLIAVIDVSGEEFDGEPGPFGGDYGDEYQLPLDFVPPQNGRARLASTTWKVSSQVRHCGIWKDSDGHWYLDLAAREYGEYEDADTYGPFSSEAQAEKYLDGFSNPGGLDVDDSGTKPPPTKSPNGGRVRRPGSTPRWANEQHAEAKLPNDGEPPVARSDYYDGDKGSNLVNASPSVGSSKLPGEAMPSKATPLTPRPSHPGEHMFATTELPGDGTDVDYEFSKDVHPGLGYRYERSNQPYIKWDSNTHNMRPDPVYQREVEGPYAKQGEG